MLRDGLLAVTIGLVTGALAAVLLARALAASLPDLRATEVMAIGPVGLLLFGAGTLAAYVPARRATRASALDALRWE
jgi:ABC-type antimicrobial peptide transport system permease subunit